MSAGSRARSDRRIVDAGVAMLSVVLIVWTIVPLYNMVRVSLQEKEDVFSSSVFPTTVSLNAFRTAFHESYWLLANFWHQMGTSLYIRVTAAFLVYRHADACFARQIVMTPDATISIAVARKESRSGTSSRRLRRAFRTAMTAGRYPASLVCRHALTPKVPRTSRIF